VPFTIDELQDISQRASDQGNKYDLMANVRFLQQIRRMPEYVTRWQHLDWCLALMETLVSNLHGADMSAMVGQPLDRNELFIVYTMIHTMVIPSIDNDIQILMRECTGENTYEALVMMINHYFEVLWRHTSCRVRGFVTCPCKELAEVACRELAQVHTQLIKSQHE